MGDVLINWPLSGGYNIAADDIAGVKHLRVKIVHGPDGSCTDASDAQPLPVKIIGGTQAGGASVPTRVGSAAVSVAAAGTRVQLPDNPTATGVTVRARTSNSGAVYLGGSNVTAANGFTLQPGEAISLDIANTSALYLDADNPGAQVRLLWAGT